MPELKGLSKLKSAQTRENLEQKREWCEEKSDKWYESEIGEEWNYHLDEVEGLIDEIDNIDYEFLK